MGDHSASGRQSDVSGDEGESDEDSSSSLDDPSTELDRFRTQWFNELRNTNTQDLQPETLDKQAEAKRLFLKGIEAEKSGRTDEAVYWYRRATHICPDVESTIEIPRRRSHRRRLKSHNSTDSAVESTSTEPSSVVTNNNQSLVEENFDEYEPDNEEDLGDLLERFRLLNVTRQRICHMQWDQTAVHISRLPTEILIRIIFFVIGKHLDVRSLDNFSLVCRGFYILSRDDQVWARICRAIWKTSVDRPGKFGLWREMYMKRPRVHFNGCYISKMTYVRQGEQSVDGFYQAVHVVEYFRYLRFYTNGRAVMVTSPEEPSLMVYKLKSPQMNVAGMQEGYYRLVDNKVGIVLQRRPTDYNKKIYRRARRGQNLNERKREETYHLEMTIKDCGKRLNHALIWNYYGIQTSYGGGSSEEAVLEMTYQNYPPLYFSPVKSYSSLTDGAL